MLRDDYEVASNGNRARIERWDGKAHMGQLAVGLAKMESVVRTGAVKGTKAGIAFPRYFTAKLEAGKTPYDEVQWETRTASIGNDKGSVIFEQRDVEVP